MILGGLFDGREPDAILVVARDSSGTVIGAHRYLWAGKQDLSLDFPLRSQDGKPYTAHVLPLTSGERRHAGRTSSTAAVGGCAISPLLLAAGAGWRLTQVAEGVVDVDRLPSPLSPQEVGTAHQ